MSEQEQVESIGRIEIAPEVLTTIYGEEDWQATIEKVEDEEDEAVA